MKYWICVAMLVMDLATAGAAGKPNLLLITLDTTRADHLGCYGNHLAKTPVIDRLAAEGTRFTQAYTTTPLTLPAHASLFTGLSPIRTGVRDNGVHRLKSSSLTLAEALRDHGYRTLAFTGAAVLDRTFGLDQGFDVYDDNVRVGVPGAFAYEERAASQVTKAATTQLSALNTPFFLWIHYYDPHFPYVPPRPFDEQFKNSPYDGEIAFMDQQVGRLLSAMQDQKLLNNTIIVVVGDHGESLGEHGESTHGVFLYRPAMQIPLILHQPGEIRKGMVIEKAVNIVDVFPTLLELAGRSDIPNTEGLSLLPLLKGEGRDRDIYEETVFPQNSFGWAPLFGLRSGDWHYVLAPRSELYNLRKDPDEANNIVNSEPAVRKLLEGKLRKHLARESESEAVEPSPELKEELESLGYTGSGPKTKAVGTLDPKDGILLLQKVEEARRLLGEGNWSSAELLLDEVLARNPENVQARSNKAYSLLNRNEYGRAEAEYLSALKYREFDYLHLGLGNALLAQRKEKDGILQIEKALALNPRYPEAYLALIEYYISGGQIDHATKTADRAISAQVRDPGIFFYRGSFSSAAENYAEAVRYFERAVEQNPRYFEAFTELGSALFQLKEIRKSAEAYERAILIQPAHIPTLKTLASVYTYNMDDPKRARELYQRALTLNPNAPDAEDLKILILELSAYR